MGGGGHATGGSETSESAHETAPEATVRRAAAAHTASCAPTPQHCWQPLRTECAGQWEGGHATGGSQTSEGTHEDAPRKATVRRAAAAHTMVLCPHTKSALPPPRGGGLGGEKSFPSGLKGGFHRPDCNSSGPGHHKGRSACTAQVGWPSQGPYWPERSSGHQKNRQKGRDDGQACWPGTCSSGV